MDQRYITWIHQHLENQSTRQTALSDVRRIESLYGDLDALYEEDGLEWVLSELGYTASDERDGKANPSRIDINGDLRKGLASYKSHLKRYIRFREDTETEHTPSETGHTLQPSEASLPEALFKYEQDLQTALIASIEQIEPGLKLAD